MSAGDDARAVNLGFYEHAYSAGGLLGAMVKRWVSYDQLSKTRRNLELARSLPGFRGRLSVFDFGFGYGTLLLGMPRRHSLSGCELSPAAVRNVSALCAVLRREALLLLAEDLEAAGLEGRFDLVCCSHVLEHVEDDRALMRRLASIASPGGHLLINVPVNEVWLDPRHVRPYTAQSLTELVEGAGCRVVSLHEADRWTAWLLEKQLAGGRAGGLLKVLRLALGVAPLWVSVATERFLPRRCRPQQLLVLAARA